MPLQRLARVGNFWFNSLSPFLSIVHILSSQAILFQILLYAHLLDRPFFLFPVIPSSITLRICKLVSPRIIWPYHHTWLWIIISSIFTTTPNLSRRTSADTLLTSLTSHIILIMRHSIPRKLVSSTTLSFHVSQQEKKIGLTQHW